MLVFPVLIAMSALLWAQIFPGGIWIWKTLAQDQPIYIFLMVIVIDYISNVNLLLSFPSSAVLGISGREGP